ncbi:MAG: hypothetical protein ACI9VR_003837 [Cognaticolwellia sp.]|jgi:hypothetical protein
MATALDPAIFALSAVLASLIVAGGWAACMVLSWMYLSKRLAALEESHGELPAPMANALLLYGLSILFWPAGFALGLYFLPKPESARLGRNCILVGLANISVIVLATCAGVASIALWRASQPNGGGPVNGPQLPKREAWPRSAYGPQTPAGSWSPSRGICGFGWKRSRPPARALR